MHGYLSLWIKLKPHKFHTLHSHLHSIQSSVERMGYVCNEFCTSTMECQQLYVLIYLTALKWTHTHTHFHQAFIVHFQVREQIPHSTSPITIFHHNFAQVVLWKAFAFSTILLSQFKITTSCFNFVDFFKWLALLCL